MKKLVLSCSLMALTLPAYAADTISCNTLPTCDDLGYTENADDCVGRKLLCPFDKTQAACLEKPKVGDLKYSLYSKNHDGWLRCDGKQYNIDDYQKLYDVIGTNFCRTFSSRTDKGTTGKCDSGIFAVPDYRGFFLRGYVSSNSTAVDKYGKSSYCSNALYYKGNYINYDGRSYCSGYGDAISVPQYERLPNIKGTWIPDFRLGSAQTADGPFQAKSGNSRKSWRTSDDNGTPYGFTFDASRSNVIYDGSHVVPANYSAYIFIYAGE